MIQDSRFVAKSIKMLPATCRRLPHRVETPAAIVKSL